MICPTCFSWLPLKHSFLRGSQYQNKIVFFTVVFYLAVGTSESSVHDFVYVWIQVCILSLRFFLFIFYFFCLAAVVDEVSSEQYICALTSLTNFNFSFKIGLKILFTHLKIIYIQYILYALQLLRILQRHSLFFIFLFVEIHY